MVFGQPKYARYGRCQAEDSGAGPKPGAGRIRLWNDPAAPKQNPLKFSQAGEKIRVFIGGVAQWIDGS